MNAHIKILDQIAAIRDLHPNIQDICLNGSCMNFHIVLRRIYPDAVAYFNIDHVITKIGNNYYDITGSVNPKGYRPLTSFYDKRNTKRAVNQMLKYNNN